MISPWTSKVDARAHNATGRQQGFHYAFFFQAHAAPPRRLFCLHPLPRRRCPRKSEGQKPAAEKPADKKAPAKVKLSLKEKRVVKGIEIAFADKVKDLNKACGTDIKVTLDWASFKGANSINKTVTSAATNALYDLAKVCRDDDGKAAIKDSVKTMTIKWADKKHREHKLEKGVLTESIWVKPEGGEYWGQTEPTLDKWLAENL